MFCFGVTCSCGRCKLKFKKYVYTIDINGWISVNRIQAEHLSKINSQLRNMPFNYIIVVFIKFIVILLPRGFQKSIQSQTIGFKPFLKEILGMIFLTFFK